MIKLGMIKLGFKTKLHIGFGFLFLMIVLLWVVGGFFIYNLSNRSAAMLHENYQSVESAEYLIKSINEIENIYVESIFSNLKINTDSLIDIKEKEFEVSLAAVESNVTESGEIEIIDSLKYYYEEYKLHFSILKTDTLIKRNFFFSTELPNFRKVQNLIISLSDMNRKAIIHKNNSLNKTAHNAFIILSVIGTICFIIAASFSFRYPKNIIKPIKQLTLGIKAIANRNYDQKLDFESNDELGELAKAFNTMSLKLNEYEHSSLSQLLFEKKRTETIINNMKDAIIGLNESQEIIFSNMLACQLLNVNSQDIVGKNASEVSARNIVLKEILRDLAEKSINEKKEFSLLKIFSNEKPSYFSKDILDVIITRTGEEENILVGHVIILKNITRYLEQDEAKTNFIATISHQLKTPISSIRFHLKLLNDSRIGQLNGEQREIIQALINESTKMLGITSELLDMAQVETGNIHLNMLATRPEQIIEYVTESSSKHARYKDVKVQFNVQKNLPFIYADGEKTAWVLINLINNAIQYSEKDQVVMIDVKEISGFVEFCVKDNGRGIEPVYLNKIFERYFRIPGSIEKGTGLGLSISKEFIVKQKGVIWAESIPNEGSCFYFRLPLFDNELVDR